MMEEDVRIDFFSELDSRNLEHVIDQICASNLTHRDIVNILRVCKTWNALLKRNDGINRGSIWRRVLHFKCTHDKIYKQMSILNRWWPDGNRPIPNEGIQEDGEIEEYTNASFIHDTMDISLKDEENLRRCAAFESVDVALDLRKNINIKRIKDNQTRSLFVGGIVSTISFCGPGGKYLFCGMLNGDIKLWELWKHDMSGNRIPEVLGRAWKVFKGHEERINGLDFLKGHDSNKKNCDTIFASTSDDHSFRIWSVLTGSQLRVVRFGTGTRVLSILILEDRILTVTSTPPRKYDITEHVDINLYKVGGCRTKMSNVDLSWWDSIELVSTSKLDNCGLHRWSISKMNDDARIALVTSSHKNRFYEIHVYSTDPIKGKEHKDFKLKEDFKHVISNHNIGLLDIAMHANMLVYTSCNYGTGENFVSLINLNSSSLGNAWSISTQYLVNNYSIGFEYRSLQYINVTSSAFLGMFQNGNIFVCCLEDLIFKFMHSNNKEFVSDKITSKSSDNIQDRFFFTSNESPDTQNILNNDNIIVRSTCLNPCGSFAFHSDGNGDTIKLYYSPSVIDLVGDLETKEIYNLPQEETSDEEFSLC